MLRSHARPRKIAGFRWPPACGSRSSPNNVPTPLSARERNPLFHEVVLSQTKNASVLVTPTGQNPGIPEASRTGEHVTGRAPMPFRDRRHLGDREPGGRDGLAVGRGRQNATAWNMRCGSYLSALSCAPSWRTGSSGPTPARRSSSPWRHGSAPTLRTQLEWIIVKAGDAPWPWLL